MARSIANVCAKYPGSVLLFERLRKIKATGASKSRRMNRRQANQLRGKINQQAREKAFVEGVVTVEVNAHGTSQYCSRLSREGREVLAPSWQTHHREMGQAVLVSGLSLRGQRGLQCLSQCASLVLPRVALAASEKGAAAGRTKRLR